MELANTKLPDAIAVSPRPSPDAYGGQADRLDAETGLYDFRARIYAPKLGRFMQADPIGYVDGVNLYAYVNNDPLNLVDPSGLVAEGMLAGLNASLFGNDAISMEILFGGGSAAAKAGTVGGLAGGFLVRTAVEAGAYLVAEGLLNRALGVVTSGSMAATANGENIALQEMLRAGQLVDRGGLTQAGRALEKHGSRGGAFPQATGNVASKNAQGEQILREILTSRNQSVTPNRFGGKDIYDAVTGRGVRYDASGKMMGFLEP